MRGAVNEERRRDHYSGLVCVTVNYIVTFHQHFMLKLGESDLDILKHTHSLTHTHTRTHARTLTHTHTLNGHTHSHTE